MPNGREGLDCFVVLGVSFMGSLELSCSLVFEQSAAGWNIHCTSEPKWELFRALDESASWHLVRKLDLR